VYVRDPRKEKEPEMRGKKGRKLYKHTTDGSPSISLLPSPNSFVTLLISLTLFILKEKYNQKRNHYIKIYNQEDRD